MAQRSEGSFAREGTASDRQGKHEESQYFAGSGFLLPPSAPRSGFYIFRVLSLEQLSVSPSHHYSES